MAIDRTAFDQVNDDTEAALIAAHRKGRDRLAELLFNDLDNANQALEAAVAAGVATATDKAKIKRLTDEVEKTTKSGDAALAAKAAKSLQNAADELRKKVTGAKPSGATTPEPKPAPEPAIDADAIAAKVLAGINPLLANGADGKPAKAASEASVERLTAEVEDIKGNLDVYGLSAKRDENGKPVPTKGTWAEYVTHGATNNASPDWRLGGIVGGIVALVVLIGAVTLGHADVLQALMAAGAAGLGVGGIVALIAASGHTRPAQPTTNTTNS